MSNIQKSQNESEINQHINTKNIEHAVMKSQQNIKLYTSQRHNPVTQIFERNIPNYR